VQSYGEKLLFSQKSSYNKYTNEKKVLTSNEKEGEKMNVFMDDTRPAPYQYMLAITVEESLSLVRQHDVEILSLDYNMGVKKPNGLDFVEAFCREGLYAKEIHIHSDDVIGVMKMTERLRIAKEKGEINAGILVRRV
jgi:hypothetical protein